MAKPPKSDAPSVPLPDVTMPVEVLPESPADEPVMTSAMQSAASLREPAKLVPLAAVDKLVHALAERCSNGTAAGLGDLRKLQRDIQALGGP